MGMRYSPGPVEDAGPVELMEDALRQSGMPRPVVSGRNHGSTRPSR